MSKRDVDEYFAQVISDYDNMLAEIKDFEQECQNGLIEPERLDQIKENIRPLMNNYERIMYIMFLYNKPARKRKVPQYEAANKKLLARVSKGNMPEASLAEDKEVLEKVKKIAKG